MLWRICLADAWHVAWGTGRVDWMIGWLVFLCGLERYSPRTLVAMATGGYLSCHEGILTFNLDRIAFSLTKTSRLVSLGLCQLVGGHFSLRVSGSHHLMFYHINVKGRLARTLRIEEVIIPRSSLLIGHGYLHHAGGRLQGIFCLPFHMWQGSEEGALNQAIAFA